MPSRRLPAVTLALFVLLSGCLAPLTGPDAPHPPPETASPAVDPPENADRRTPASGVSTDASVGTARYGAPDSTPAADGSNPWGTDPIVVAVDGPEDAERDWVPIVRSATAYWEEHAETYAGYSVAYEVRPDAADPDLIVEFVDDVPECAGVDEAAGCAPVVTDERQLDRPETVSVGTGFSEESTAFVLRHELGHTLGLTHEDEPADVMAGHSLLETTPRPNATEREFPWADGEFAVYVDAANASDPAGAREQVAPALDYYERGAPGMSENLTFETVDDPDAADVVVSFADRSPCAPDAASCGATSGWDPDGDGAIETYATLRVTLVDLDSDAVGWHVGYWLAFGLGAEDDADKPAPFRDASYDERRSEWWR